MCAGVRTHGPETAHKRRNWLFHRTAAAPLTSRKPGKAPAFPDLHDLSATPVDGIGRYSPRPGRSSVFRCGRRPARNRLPSGRPKLFGRALGRRGRKGVGRGTAGVLSRGRGLKKQGSALPEPQNAGVFGLERTITRLSALKAGNGPLGRRQTYVNRHVISAEFRRGCQTASFVCYLAAVADQAWTACRAGRCRPARSTQTGVS